MRGGDRPDRRPRLLLIRDSYSDSLTPFLTQSFSQIHLFDPRYNLSSIQGYIQDNGIDAVAVLYSIPNYIADEYQSCCPADARKKRAHENLEKRL